VNDRNFLILPKFFESAFDCDAMLLLPRRGLPPVVSARINRPELLPVEGEQLARLVNFCKTAPQLYLPLASAGHVPFLRVLGWKALSAIRERSEDAAATDTAPDYFDADVSGSNTDAEGVTPLRRAIAKAKVRSTLVAEEGVDSIGAAVGVRLASPSGAGLLGGCRPHLTSMRTVRGHT